MGTGRAGPLREVTFLSATQRFLQRLEKGAGEGEPIRFLKCLSSCKLMHMNRECLYEATKPRAKGHLTTPKGRRKLELGAGGNNKGCIKMVNNGIQRLSPESK